MKVSVHKYIEEKNVPNTDAPTWPEWPRVSPNTLQNLSDVLHSGRWTMSGFYTGRETYNEKFCKAFSAYIGTKYCIAMDHGSNALLASLQALGVNYGDEVIVPGLTWVACATVVLQANAIPIFVDIEAATQCLDPKHVEEAITEKTKAIMVVHLHNCMADMETLQVLSQKYKIPLIEDCSQAHGAMWDKHKAGSLGHIGVFSMQQGKPLTCGEGAAVVTSDRYLYERLLQLTFSGRLLNHNPQKGRQQLEESGELIGSNFSLSEFQAAVLLEELKYLEVYNKQRQKSAAYLDNALQSIEGVIPLKPHSANQKRSFYQYVVRYDQTHYRASAETICDFLSERLGTWVHQPYVPLNRHPLFRPSQDGRFDHLSLPNYQRCFLKNCETQYDSSLLLHHRLLLAEKNQLDRIVMAFKELKIFSEKI